MAGDDRRRVRWWVRAFRTAGLAAAVACLLLTVTAMFLGDRFIFFPGRADESWERARHAQFPIEEVAFLAADGTKLVSWQLRVEKPRATVLFFHGNAGNLSHRIEILTTLAQLGCDVLIVGYHGYGKSEGEPSEKGIYEDADAAYAYLTEKCAVPPERLLLLGESLGGGPAIDLAARRPCAGLIVQSSFTSIRDMAARAIPLFPSHWFMKSKIDNLAKIPRVRAPKLFFATKRDEVVPYDQTRRLHDASAPPCSWVAFDDCGHNDLFWKHRREWSEAIEKFVNETVPRGAP